MNIIEPTYNYIGWNNEDPDEHLEKYNVQYIFHFSRIIHFIKLTLKRSEIVKSQNCFYTDTYD